MWALDGCAVLVQFGRLWRERLRPLLGRLHCSPFSVQSEQEALHQLWRFEVGRYKSGACSFPPFFGVRKCQLNSLQLPCRPPCSFDARNGRVHKVSPEYSFSTRRDSTLPSMMRSLPASASFRNTIPSFLILQPDLLVNPRRLPRNRPFISATDSRKARRA